MTSREQHGALNLDGAHAPNVRIQDEFGLPVVVVNGVVQSVDVAAAGDGYWDLMLPELRPRRGLLLGFGGGTLARRLDEQFGAFPIVGVDISAAVLAAGREAFGPPPAGVQLVLADALTFVHGCAGWFDYVGVDLFVAGETVPEAFERPFLEAVRDALKPNGQAAFNLFHDDSTSQRVSRLRQVFRQVQSVPVGGNLVLQCKK